MKISMIKYKDQGDVLDVVIGDYKPRDVQRFRNEGYVDIDEDFAITEESELLEIVNMGVN